MLRIWITKKLCEYLEFEYIHRLHEITKFCSRADLMGGLKKWDEKFQRFGKIVPDNVNIKPYSICPVNMLVCANTRRGKSYFIRSIYLKFLKDKYDKVILFSQNCDTGQYDYFENCSKYKKWDPKVIEVLENTQAQRKMFGRYYFNYLIVFDDYFSNEAFYSDVCTQIFTSGRHKAFSIIYCIQSPTMLQQICRQNITHLFMLQLLGMGREHIINNFVVDALDIDNIPEKYKKGNLLASLKSFANNIVTKVWRKKYCIVVIDYLRDNLGWRDFIFWYKAC
jgi:hypothetical protein